MADKVLIVDDTLNTVSALQLMLQQTDYNVSACYSVKEALEQLSREKPDIILLDAVMPGLSGFDLCERLKLDDATKDIPVIMLTALQRLDDKIRGLDCGADDFLTKPFKEMELLARMRAHLRRKHLQDNLKASEKELEQLGRPTEEMADSSQKLIVWRKIWLPLAWAMGFSSVYVFFRYIIFKGVPVSHLPAYVLNKSLAISAVALMCSSYIIGPLARLNLEKFGRYRSWRKSLGITGLGLLVAHVCLSLATLTPAYHQKLFQTDGAYIWTFEISLTLAVLAVIHLIFLGVASVQSVSRDMTMKQWLQIQRSGLVALAFGCGHLGFMGYANWFDPAKWYGGMMPSTLLAASMIIGTFLFRAYAKRG